MCRTASADPIKNPAVTRSANACFLFTHFARLKFRLQEIPIRVSASRWKESPPHLPRSRINDQSVRMSPCDLKAPGRAIHSSSHRQRHDHPSQYPDQRTLQIKLYFHDLQE